MELKAIFLSLLAVIFVYGIPYAHNFGSSAVLWPKHSTAFGRFYQRHWKNIRLTGSVLCGMNAYLLLQDYLFGAYLSVVCISFLVWYIFVISRSTYFHVKGSRS